MFPRNEKSDELLSGFLDGELSIEEANEARRLLSEDTEAANSLEKLRRIQSALSSLPTQRLDSQFSNRVLEQAKLRAAEMGSNSPSWISPKVIPSSLQERVARENGAHETVEPKRSSRGSMLWAWGAMGAVAASIALVVFMNRPESKLGLLDPSVATKSGSESKESQLTKGDSPVVSPGDTLAGKSNTDNVIPVGPTTSNLANNNANNNAATKDPSNKDPSESVTPPQVPDSMLATNKAPGNGVNATGEMKTGVDPIVSTAIKPTDSESDKAFMNAIEKSIQSGMGARFLLVVDLSVSKNAWNDETFLELLTKNDIPYSNPVAITPELQSDLASSRMVNKLSDQNNSDPNVALILVKARAERLDAIITDAFGYYKDFPDFSFDLAVDAAATKTLKGLEGIREFGEYKGEGKNGIAKALTLEAKKSDLAQFAAAPRRGTPSRLEERKVPGATLGVSSMLMNPVEYCLFILRPQPE